eukprot:scaffold3443_cov404-Prasinococcus_capsulatus_cf.AAC.2
MDYLRCRGCLARPPVLMEPGHLRRLQIENSTCWLTTPDLCRSGLSCGDIVFACSGARARACARRSAQRAVTSVLCEDGLVQ